MFIFNNILINFLKEKNKLIERYAGKESGYVTKEDLEEIKDLKPWECLAILDSLRNTDPESCPWCIYRKIFGFRTVSEELHILIRIFNCDNCGYGKRHGICSNEFYNTYDNVRHILNDKHRIINICSVPGMDELFNKTMLKYSKVTEVLKSIK